MTSDRPIFIVGMPRSGTTLLRAMLCAHSRITISPESHFLNYWLRQYQHLDLREREGFDEFWSAFSSSQRFSYFGVEPEGLRSRLLSTSDISFKHIFQSLLEAYAQRMDKPRWGEKTPIHHEHLDTLFDWFPNAQVIWTLRDPRATTASLMQVDWASRYAFVNAEWWHRSLQGFEQRWAKDQRVFLLRYEALVQHPQATLQSLCHFLGEGFEPGMVQARQEKDMPIVHTSGWARKHFQAALSPLHQEAVKKWQTELSSTQIAIVEHCVRSVMMRYGYQPQTQKLAPWQTGWLKLSRRQYHWDLKLQSLKQAWAQTSLEEKWIGTLPKPLRKLQPYSLSLSAQVPLKSNPIH